MPEFRSFGPPGTGKTTRLATRDIPRAAEKFGSDKVMVASFTRTAAREIATKKSVDTGLTIPINPKNVGTLHKICYQALGCPDLTEKHIRKWNDQYPQYPIGTAGGDVMEDGLIEESIGGDGDRLLGRMNILRNKMIPRDRWPTLVQAFARKWDGFKGDLGIVDFTDLIEKAYHDLPLAPGNPRVMFLDEAQDFTPLQLRLVRSWGMHMDWFILVGDDDQCIYKFSGADPRTFLEPAISDKYKVVLNQSYRVPQAVHERAMRIIKRVEHREPKEYLPRNAKGKVAEMAGNWKNPEDYLNYFLQKNLTDSKTVMILASCSYMLDPIRKVLIDNGIPFHNPYRRRRGDWNPLVRRSDAVTAADLLASFIGTGTDGPFWTVPQLLRWAQHLKVDNDTGLLRKKGSAGLAALKDAVDKNVEGLHSTRNVLDVLLGPTAKERALERDLDWLVDNLKKGRQDGMKYPLGVYRNFGLPGLEEAPRVTIGTIHSVKGGESDVVMLYPDISFKAQKEIDSSRDAEDAAYRLFYVGMTRAREELVLMEPACPKTSGRTALYVEL